MKIPWHKVTWYTKLGAVIVLFVILPALSFCFGRMYQEVIDAERGIVPAMHGKYE